MRTVNKTMARSRFAELSLWAAVSAAALAGVDSKADAYEERGAGMVVSAPDVGTGRSEQECPGIGGALSCASIFAQGEGTSHGELQPRYDPVPPQ